mmetsp:Transcript_7812/g.14972  ORF Transcript_7812/g.14972 Transcript_7812/m.14972 type:complete len:678 (-) Transcript_7812:1359-3392(-)
MISLKLIHDQEVRRLNPAPATLEELTLKVKNDYKFQFNFYLAKQVDAQTKVPISNEAEYLDHINATKPSEPCRIFLCEIEEARQISGSFLQTVEEIKSDSERFSQEPEKSVLDNPEFDPKSEVYVADQTAKQGHPEVDFSVVGAKHAESDDEGVESSSESVYSSEDDEDEEEEVIPLPTKVVKPGEISLLLSQRVGDSRFMAPASDKAGGKSELGIGEKPSQKETVEVIEEPSIKEETKLVDQATWTPTTVITDNSSNTEQKDMKEQASNCEDREIQEIGCEALSIETQEQASNTPSLEFAEQGVSTEVDLENKGTDSISTEMVDSASDAHHATFLDAQTGEPVETTEFYTNTSLELPSLSDASVDAIQPSQDMSTDPLTAELVDNFSNTVLETSEKAIDRMSVEMVEASTHHTVETFEQNLGTEIETLERSISAFYPESIDQMCGHTVDTFESGCDAIEISETSTETQSIVNVHAATEPHPIERSDFAVHAFAENCEAYTETEHQKKHEAEAMTEIPLPPDPEEIYQQALEDFRTALRLEFSTLRSNKRKNMAGQHSIGCMKCSASPIKGARFVCVKCPEVSMCSSCEPDFIHPHALLKLRSESQRKYYQELLIPAASLTQDLTKSLAVDELSDKVEKIRRMGFDDVALIMHKLVKYNYNVDMAVEALLADDNTGR